MQEVVAQSPRGVLTIQPLCRRLARHVDRLHCDRKVHRIGKAATERLIAIRCRPQPMIQMRETGDGEATVLGQLAQDEREGNGIRAAGQAHQDTAADRTQTMSLNGAADVLVKRGHSMPNAQCPMPNAQCPKKPAAPNRGLAWALCIGP